MRHFFFITTGDHILFAGSQSLVSCPQEELSENFATDNTVPKELLNLFKENPDLEELYLEFSKVPFNKSELITSAMLINPELYEILSDRLVDISIDLDIDIVMIMPCIDRSKAITGDKITTENSRYRRQVLFENENKSKSVVLEDQPLISINFCSESEKQRFLDQFFAWVGEYRAINKQDKLES